MKTYYDIHVFHSRNDGFSIPVMIENDDSLLDEDVINHAVNTELLDLEDADHVDYVEEIDEEQYNIMKD